MESELDLSDLYDSLKKENIIEDEVLHELSNWFNESEDIFSMDILKETNNFNKEKLNEGSSNEGNQNHENNDNKENSESDKKEIKSDHESDEYHESDEDCESSDDRESDEDSETNEDSEIDEDSETDEEREYNVENAEDGNNNTFEESNSDSINSVSSTICSHNNENYPQIVQQMAINNIMTQPQTLFELRKQAIYKMIASDIGAKWRKFGCGLEIREGEMDKLQFKFDRETRVLKMFDILEYNEFFNLERVYYKIIKSLEENCNHYDLSNRVQLAMIK